MSLFYYSIIRFNVSVIAEKHTYQFYYQNDPMEHVDASLPVKWQKM